MADEQQATWLLTELEELEKNYHKRAFRWKWSYRTLLVLTAVLSASAAVVANLSFDCASDCAAILAALATVTTTVIGSLEFDSNWRSNRRARCQAHMLIIDMHKDNSNLDQIFEGLKATIASRGLDDNDRTEDE